MKVHELITDLQNRDPDALVVVSVYGTHVEVGSTLSYCATVERDPERAPEYIPAEDGTPDTVPVVFISDEP